MNKKLLTFSLLVLVILFYCLDYFFRISPGLIVHPLLLQYQTTALGIGGFASAFYLGYTIMHLPGGYLLDRFSLQYILSLAVVSCCLFYMAFLFSKIYILGCILRLLIGATSAISFIAVLYVARVFFPANWFSFISSIAISAGTLFASLIQVAAAGLMHVYSWQFIFSLVAIAGIFIGGIIFINTKMIHQRSHLNADLSNYTLKNIIGLFKNRALVLNACISGLFYLPTTLFVALWGIPFLEQHYHLNEATAAFGITLLFLGWAIGAPIIGFMADRIKNFLIITRTTAILAVITSVILLFATTNPLILLLLFGLFSSAQVVVWKIFKEHCPVDLSGIGAAYTNMLIMSFGTIFHLVVGYLVEYGWLSNNLHQPDYQLGLTIMPLAFALVFVLSLFVPNK